MMAPHAFASLSHAQQVADIRRADIWPINNVGWDSAHGLMQLTLEHHAAKVELAQVPPSPEMLDMTALWWHVAADVVLPLVKDHLSVHDPNHHWASYTEDITYFANVMATLGEPGRRNVQMEAAHWLSPLPSKLLRNKTTHSFLSIMMWNEEIIPAYGRVPLIMWLSKWTATKSGRTLALGGFTLGGDCIWPGPPSETEWEGRLKESKVALCCHDLVGRIAATALKDISNATGSQEEAYFTVMTAAASECPSDFLKSLQIFLADPKDAVPNISIGPKALLQTMDLGTNAANIIGAVTSAASLAAAVKAIYTMTPPTRQPVSGSKLPRPWDLWKNSGGRPGRATSERNLQKHCCRT